MFKVITTQTLNIKFQSYIYSIECLYGFEVRVGNEGKIYADLMIFVLVV